MNLLRNILNNKTDIFYLLLPLISGYITAFFCPMKKSAAKNVVFRPPSYVFGIVWPILYLMLGYAWVNSKNLSIWYLGVTLSLCLWLIVYSCQNNKEGAIGINLLSILLVLICYTLSDTLSKLLLLPLLVWLGFALLLSLFDISNIQKSKYE